MPQAKLNESEKHDNRGLILDLSWNKLRNVCSNVLGRLVNLKHLNLANNVIKSINPELQEINQLQKMTSFQIGGAFSTTNAILCNQIELVS